MSVITDPTPLARLYMVKVPTPEGTLADADVSFVQAKNYTAVDPGKPRKIDLVVMHTMEAPETTQTANNVAKWFGGKNAPKASAHFCVDEASIVQCVSMADVAWHAPGANSRGVGVEQAGFARMTEFEWGSPKSAAMLRNAAGLVAAVCMAFDVPPIFLQEHDLLSGCCRGITTHAQVNQAFHRSNHTDPGVGYPITAFVESVRWTIARALNPYTIFH